VTQYLQPRDIGKIKIEDQEFDWQQARFDRLRCIAGLAIYIYRYLRYQGVQAFPGEFIHNDLMASEV